MNRKEWQAIDQARELLKLDDRATLGEMKRAYHRMSKKYHPDRSGETEEHSEIMYRITEAYELLMRYTKEYRFPLIPGDSEIYDAEDWWMDRFGQDPLWSNQNHRRR
jgi:hypothetical protein